MTKHTGAAWIGVALLAAGLSACGQPQAPEPAPVAPAAEAAPELLGGPSVELAAAPMPTETVSAQAAPALRPGWGTMAPIPNPDDDAQTRLASAPAYRVVGPAAAEPDRRPVRSAAQRPVLRGKISPVVRAPVRPAGWVQVGGGAAPAPQLAKGRVRHWIMPVAQR